MGYMTAYLEAWSITSFPHYSYPDADAMLGVGSGFYALHFLVSFPMYVELHRAHASGEMWDMWQVFCHALAASMLILTFYEVWRLTIGRISPLVDDTACPPFTHNVVGQSRSLEPCLPS